MISVRSALCILSTALLALSPCSALAANLALTLNFANGTSLTFSQTAATDVGDYVGPAVHQKSFEQRQGDWTVFFRPDADGSRNEVVVELGTIRTSSPYHILPMSNCRTYLNGGDASLSCKGPYTATISDNGTVLATITVPVHWWWSRWRWQSAPRPFVRSAASLIGGNAVLPYTPAYLYGYSGWTTPYTYDGPMSLAGVNPGMSNVGDRPELGPITLPQSDWLILGTPLAKSSMIAQAEANASLPVHVRDEQTGAWFNPQANPYYAILNGGGCPCIPTPPIPRDANGNYFPSPAFAVVEAAHTPSLDYVPYLLTDDPYYLEEAQAIALLHIVYSSWHQSANQLPGLVYPGEPRAYGWGVRSVALAAFATPTVVPSWLNTKAEWLQNLADNRTFLRKYQNSPSAVQTRFHAFPESNGASSFQSDYIGIALAWIVRLGYSEWADGYRWFMGSVLPQVSDGSGWLKGWPAPYSYYMFLNTVNAPTTMLVPDTSQDANTLADWAAVFKQYCLDRGGTNDPTLGSCPPAWDRVSIYQRQSSAAYFLWRAGSLHLASGLGVPGAAAASTWLDSQITILLGPTKYGGTSDPRWSFRTTLGAPLPPVNVRILR